MESDQLTMKAKPRLAPTPVTLKRHQIHLIYDILEQLEKVAMTRAVLQDCFEVMCPLQMTVRRGDSIVFV